MRVATLVLVFIGFVSEVDKLEKANKLQWTGSFLGFLGAPTLPPNDILSNGTSENELLTGGHSRRQP
jgi:hypothetical protein